MGQKKLPFKIKNKPPGKNTIKSRGASATTVSSNLYSKEPENDAVSFGTSTVKINQQPSSSSNQGRGGGRSNRYNLEFCKEKLDAEYERGKEEMHQRVHLADPVDVECSSDDFFLEGLTFPQRPEKCQNMDLDTLEREENSVVISFDNDMKSKFRTKDLNLYEQNLETWRQLWRVCERSTVLLFITDVRYAVAQFPFYVYENLQSQNKGIILVLNKIDLVPASLVIAWTEYFQKKFPKLKVVPFCSHELKSDKHRRARISLNSCKNLISAIEKITNSSVDLSSWRTHIEKYLNDVEEDPEEKRKEKRQERRQKRAHKLNALQDDHEESDQEIESEETPTEYNLTHNPQVFTIGTIGYPNAGKSSLINAIMGANKVGVSQNPGYTKHFQTHYLSPKKDILLCDCPGLIFPAIVPYKLQVLSGTFPVSQVRSPMSIIGYLASHVNVRRVLGITLPEEYRDRSLPADSCWTPYAIAEAWANKRKYFVKSKGGREDVNRGANEILRFSLNGRNNLILSLKPLGYNNNLAEFRNHENTSFIESLQGIHAENTKLVANLLSHSWKNSREPKNSSKVTAGDAEDLLLNMTKAKKSKRRKRNKLNEQFAALTISDEELSDSDKSFIELTEMPE